MENEEIFMLNRTKYRKTVYLTEYELEELRESFDRLLRDVLSEEEIKLLEEIEWVKEKIGLEIRKVYGLH
mgnify:CR=1 FL=1